MYPVAEVLMECTGDARWDQAQAEYVARQLPAEQGGKWEAYSCGTHWHVREIAPTEQVWDSNGDLW